MLFTASGTIIVSRFVKSSGSATVAANTTAGGKVVGISQDSGHSPPLPSLTADPVEAAKSGMTLNVHCHFEGNNFPCVEIGSGGCTAGDYLVSDNTGKAVVAATAGHTVAAIAMETASAGEKAKVRLVGPFTFYTA